MTPVGWKSTTLDAASDPTASIRYGVVQIGPHTPDGVPIVAIKFIRRIATAPLHRASQKIEGPYKNSRVQGGDVLLSVKGTIGEVGIVPLGFNGNIAREIARIRPSKDVHADYLAYQLHSSGTQVRIRALTVGTTRLEFSIAAVKKFKIPLPPLPEQRRIAEILGVWDLAIATVEALIVNATVQKRALMQSILTGKNRLPGFSGVWMTAKLGNLCQISKGEQLGRLAMIDYGTVPVINGGISASGYTDRANAPGGCITISEGGNSCGFVSLIDQPFWCGGHCYALKDPRVDKSFLFASLKHREAEIMTLRVGSGLPNIQKKALSSFELLVPPREEQEAIGKCADVQSAAIQGLENQLAALRQEKAALMQQLLTGKRRVKVEANIDA